MKDETKWTLLVTGATVVAGWATRKALAKAWSKLGSTPPPEDPELARTGVGKALAWTIAVAGSAGAARFLARRAAAGLWKASTSHAPPKKLSVLKT